MADIFPILDRRAPLIERVRNLRNGGAFESFGKTLAQSAAQSPDERLEVTMEVEEAIRKGIASELGVEPTEVNQETTERIAAVFADADFTDLLTDESIKDHDLVDESILENDSGINDSLLADNNTEEQEDVDETSEENSNSDGEVDEEESEDSSPTFGDNED